MKRFVFLDFETTGLDERNCAPIEVAVIVTDERLQELGSCESLIRPLDCCTWEDAARELHERSGLAALAERDSSSLATLQRGFSSFLSRFASPGVSLHLAGNSVHFDRRFLAHYFPDVERMLHHRHLDVSSIRMLAEAAGHPPRTGDAHRQHRAMADVRASLEDARHFLGVLRC